MPEPVPISVSASPRFLVGRDSRGRWVARDHRGLRGGLFVNHVEAIRFAIRETGRRPGAVAIVSGILELDLAGAATMRRAA